MNSMCDDISNRINSIQNEITDFERKRLPTDKDGSVIIVLNNFLKELDDLDRKNTTISKELVTVLTESHHKDIKNLISTILLIKKNIQEMTEQNSVKSYDPNKDCFGENYKISSYKGLSAGANGGVEKIKVLDSMGKERTFAMKTCHPYIIFNTESLHVLGEAIQKNGVLDINENIGWTKCTGREKIKIYNLAKECNISNITSLEKLEDAFTIDQIKQFRQEIFGSEDGGMGRMPDIHLKMLIAFGRNCLEDLRELGNLGESDIRQEAKMYRELGQTEHPNILQMISFGKKEADNPNDLSGCYLVMEFADGGSFSNFLDDNPHLSLEKAIHYGSQLANGLSFLTDYDLIHRDFKIDNVLIGKDNKLRISDFGTACSSKKLEGVAGNPDAMPPEYGVPDHHQSKYDCWGLGFILLRLAAGKEAEDKIDNLQEILDPIKESYRKALILGDSQLINNERERLVKCIELGVDGQKTGLDHSFGQSPEIKQLTFLV